MKTIKLTQNKETMVDDEDYEWLSQWKWTYHLGYAVRSEKRKYLHMHREILKYHGLLEEEKQVDHINHNKSDNQKKNLRMATQSQNNMNQNKYFNCSSQYKGICLNKRTQKWLVRIGLNGKRFNLGTFDTEIEAAQKYNQKAIELFGEFTKLNCI